LKLTADDSLHEELALDYQLAEVDRLNRVLLNNGVSDPALRQAICAEFSAANGRFFDCGWLEGHHERVWPELHFSRRPLDPRGGLGGVEELITPEYGSNLYETASGTAFDYFDEAEETLHDLQVGSL
jgi:hypothetical protein